MERTDTASGRRTLLALWLIAIVYVLSIDLKGIWTDEGARFILISGGKTWRQYNQSGFGTFAEVVKAVGASVYQPLFYLVDNAVVRLAHSHSDILLRLINVIWLLLGAHGLLRFFRRYSEASRLFALAVYALNGFMLMNVMQIREYPVYVAMLCWASAFCFDVLETAAEAPWREWWPRLGAYGVVAALLFYSHPYSVFALAAQAVMFLTRKRDRRLFLRRLTLSYGVAGALVAPWLVMIFIWFPKRLDLGIWDTRPPTLSLLFSTLIGGFRLLLAYDLWSGYPFIQAAVVLLLVGIPASWVVTKVLGEKVDARVVYAALTIVFFGMFQISYFFKQALATWPRYFVAYYFGYTVLATGAYAVLERFSYRRDATIFKFVPTGALLLVCLSGLSQVQAYRKDPYMDTGMTGLCNWRVVSRSMAQHVRPEDSIAYYFPLQAWTMGVTNPYYPKELSYEQILSGPRPNESGIWVFDTSVTPDYLARTLARLASLGYRKTKTVDLGCQCQLFRYEMSTIMEEGSASRIAAPPPSNAILIDAEAGHFGTATIDRTLFGVNLPVLLTRTFPAWAEYGVSVPIAGRYEVRVRCASEAARPVRLSLNGRLLTDDFCGLPTGGYFPQHQRWQSSGTHEFPKGSVMLRLESAGPFPCIASMALVPAAKKRPE